LGASLITTGANADDATDALFRDGVAALESGRPIQAIATFEALADQGVLDPVASYDRALAYAMRVRLDAEIAGDLGRAAHGFEEARALTGDPALANDSKVALATLRTEVARRRAKAGEPIEVDPGVPVFRAASSLLSEDAWLLIALLASVVFAIGAFARSGSQARRVRVSGVVAASIASLVLVSSAMLGVLARNDRLHLREAVVVAPSARSCDDHGVAILGVAAIPEAARVELLGELDGEKTEERRELDHRVHGHRRSVLEWIADGVADDARIVKGRSLFLELDFDDLLRVVPSTAAVVHEHGEQNARDGAHHQESCHCHRAQRKRV